MSGRLTTHVLDLVAGEPAAGLLIELWRCSDAVLLRSVVTNQDGRVDAPLLQGDDLRPGVYELRFHAGDYLRRGGADVAEPAFLDVIPIRFGIAHSDQHYHVPLLLSTYGYSTYRGS
ncbi:MAG TPA: hydroxyisourate hydrolase [Terriglobia bacterium]|nr:hydroxyisourate hydrolase [Terriglobia bacterium]